MTEYQKKTPLIAVLAFADMGYGIIACNTQNKPADDKQGKVDLTSLPAADQKLIKQGNCFLIYQAYVNVAHPCYYFHDGSVWRLKQAIAIMGELQLDQKFTEEELTNIAAF